MKTIPQTPSAWHTFFRQEPKFSVWIALLSIVMLLGVVFLWQSPEGTSWFCSLPDLSGFKELMLRYPKI